MATWPLAARAQQGERVRRVVAYLQAFAENDPEAQLREAALREGLAQLGWTERNVRIEQRFAEVDFPQFQAYAAELVASAPDVIVANSGSPTSFPLPAHGHEKSCGPTVLRPESWRPVAQLFDRRVATPGEHRLECRRAGQTPQRLISG
jgi:hypothetical protein